jgi:hypothetical protein
MKSSRTLRRTITISALLCTPLMLVGCSSGPSHAGDINSIRWDPSPAMRTLEKRDTDGKNTHAYVKDSNLRMLSTDINRALYTDRPSRLHLGIKP